MSDSGPVPVLPSGPEAIDCVRFSHPLAARHAATRMTEIVFMLHFWVLRQISPSALLAER